MADKHSAHPDPRLALRPLLRPLAAAAGALGAIVALLCGAPVWVACLRGGLAWLGTWLVSELGLFALQLAMDSDRAARHPAAGPAARRAPPRVSGNGRERKG